MRQQARDTAADAPDELLGIAWRQSVPSRRPLAEAAQGDGTSAVDPGAADPVDPAVAKLMALADPGASGWASEALSESAGAALKSLAATMLAHRDDRTWEAGVTELLAQDFWCSVADASPLERVFESGAFSVRRSKSGDGVGTSGGKTVGSGALRAMAKEFVGEQVPAPQLDFKVKGIEIQGESFETRVGVALVGGGGGAGMVQKNAIWNCRWLQPAGEDSAPRLQSIEGVRFEEVNSSAASTIFEDCSVAVMAGEESYRTQFSRDNGYWAQRLSILEGTSFLGHHGLAVGDVDGDRLDDLYVCDGGGLPNRLFLQQGDGTVRDVSRGSGADWLEYTPAALLVDLDGDRDADLVLATVAMILFMENDGSGKFTLRGGHPGVAQARSLCAADYDGDADLDIYVCSYANPNRATGFGTRGVSSSIPLPYNDAENGSRNALLENHGEFRFADATKEVGLDSDNTRFSFAASWEDFDLDGDADLYVANDFGRNCLYRNDAGAGAGERYFKNVAAELGVEDMASGMSVCWGDCNSDGRADLYVGNMFSSAGQRVAYQRRFEGERDAAGLAGLRRMARGNSLFLGGGEGGRLDDVSEAARVTMGRWAWSSLFTDFNNDGRLDIVVSNGFLTNRSTDDL